MSSDITETMLNLHQEHTQPIVKQENTVAMGVPAESCVPGSVTRISFIDCNILQVVLRLEDFVAALQFLNETLLKKNLDKSAVNAEIIEIGHGRESLSVSGNSRSLYLISDYQLFSRLTRDCADMARESLATCHKHIDFVHNSTKHILDTIHRFLNRSKDEALRNVNLVTLLVRCEAFLNFLWKKIKNLQMVSNAIEVLSNALEVVADLLKTLSNGFQSATVTNNLKINAIRANTLASFCKNAADLVSIASHGEVEYNVLGLVQKIATELRYTNNLLSSLYLESLKMTIPMIQHLSDCYREYFQK